MMGFHKRGAAPAVLLVFLAIAGVFGSQVYLDQSQSQHHYDSYMSSFDAPAFSGQATRRTTRDGAPQTRRGSFVSAPTIRIEAPACQNNRRDIGETAVDCGGPRCNGCPLHQACNLHRDCASNHCKSGKCVAECSTVKEPVCAEKNTIEKTYQNKCFAQKNGATVIHEGACEQKGCCCDLETRGSVGGITTQSQCSKEFYQINEQDLSYTRGFCARKCQQLQPKPVELPQIEEVVPQDLEEPISGVEPVGDIEPTDVPPGVIPIDGPIIEIDESLPPGSDLVKVEPVEEQPSPVTTRRGGVARPSIVLESEIPSECKDEDGMDEFTRSFAEGIGRAGNAVVFLDKCFNSITLNEAICNNQNQVVYKQFRCAQGCKDGTCNQDRVTPEPEPPVQIAPILVEEPTVSPPPVVKEEPIEELEPSTQPFLETPQACAPDQGTACGCGGTVQCDGTCDAPSCGSAQECKDGLCVDKCDAKQGQACGCGGTIQCDGSCSKASCNANQECKNGQCVAKCVPNQGTACGCGGTVTCNGVCSKASCNANQECKNGQCVAKCVPQCVNKYVPELDDYMSAGDQSRFCSSFSWSDGCGGRCYGTRAKRDGYWGPWKAVGSCGQYLFGQQYYERYCNSPLCGGRACSGNSKMWQHCQQQPTCQRINGGWSSWQNKGNCGQYRFGQQLQERTCTNPRPSCGGSSCSGSYQRYTACAAGMKPITVPSWQQLPSAPTQGAGGGWVQVQPPRTVIPFGGISQPSQPTAAHCPGGQGCCCMYGFPGCNSGLECRGWIVPGKNYFGTCTPRGRMNAWPLHSSQQPYCGK